MSGLSRKAKRRKMIMEEDKEFNDEKSIQASIRSAKKASRPGKIGEPEKKPTGPAKKKRKTVVKKPRAGGSAFESDFGSKPKVREGIRARKDDAVKGVKRGGAKPGKVGGKTKGKPRRK